MVSIPELLRDLDSEGAELDGLVADLTPLQWQLLTAAPGWTIAHQIAHLAWTDDVALISVTRPADFLPTINAGLAAAGSVPGYLEAEAARGAEADPSELLARWRAGRAELAASLEQCSSGMSLPWLGTSMSPESMITARLMETWAHAQDVADARGVVRTATGRLRHVAHIGVRARSSAFRANELPAPDADIRVELTAPDGTLWCWGASDAAGRVTGSALDFCFRVTQRRHRDDLDLVATGAVADQWLDIAQAFAGPPGAGRRPGQHSTERDTQQ
jgi:uncharacterized protein (TIGR03084 family)